MVGKQIELKKYLAGLSENMPVAFFHLAEVFKYQVFELCEDKNTGDYLIPYMMNDALEYYFVLKEARLVGEYLPDQKIFSAQIVQDSEKYVLILRQDTDNICTIHFKNIEEHAQCYQYHRIGHFWVQGQEQWRQLVYMIGTMYDKYEYFGERFCNEKELELINLIRFAPFREWSPIRESLEEKYPDSEKGLEVMYQLAVEADDKGYQKLLDLYRKFPNRCMMRLLSRRLMSWKSQNLYDLIFKKVEAASSEYIERDYGALKNQAITEMRLETEKRFLDAGYIGTYPIFRKNNIQIVAAEEHPFTIMENEEYVFRIQLMVSECKKKFFPKDSTKDNRNAGFFRGKGRRGWIENVELRQYGGSESGIRT